MMSSRPQSALFADKENSTHAAPSRKAPGMVLAPQNLLKTPNAKHLQNQGVRTAKASSSKQIHYLASNKAYKGVGAATIALEPGARILGAKDGNNRSGLTSRAQSYAGKGKGKALDSVYEDCSLMTSIKHPPATKTRSLSGSHKAEKQLRVTATSPPSKPSRIHKTPAKVNRESAALFATTPAATQETPPLGAPKASQRASPRPNSFFSVLSAFKTPSPNQLLRRRKGAGSPVPLHFNPTSLRGDDSGNDLPDSKPPKPTLLEELDAQHAAIDDLQDVDCATRQAIDPADLPVDLPFDMPNYREMNVLSINFKCTFGQEASRAIDQPVPIPSDDADVHLRDFVYDHEPERERLFPPPKRNPVKVAISRATPSGNDNMHKRNPPGTRLAKMSNDPIRRHAKLDQGLDTGGTRLLVDKRRPRSLLPSPRSVSPRAHAGNLVRANDPCCLLRPEDIPDAIIFELKEIHLLE